METGTVTQTCHILREQTLEKIKIDWLPQVICAELLIINSLKSSGWKKSYLENNIFILISLISKTNNAQLHPNYSQKMKTCICTDNAVIMITVQWLNLVENIKGKPQTGQCSSDTIN